MLNRDLQRKILTSPRETYPDVTELKSFLDLTDWNTQANLFYLAEHNLIAPGAQRAGMHGSPPLMFTAQITAVGLDFLEDDGGLGAILNIVTVKMDADNLKTILETGIRESDLSGDEKKSINAKIRSFSGDVLKAVVIKLVERGIEKPDQIATLVSVISRL